MIRRLRLIRSWRWLPIKPVEGQAGGGRPFLLHLLGGCSEKELSVVVARSATISVSELKEALVRG